MIKQKINDNFNKFEKDEHYGVVYGFNFKEAVIWYKIADENLVTSKVLLNNDRFAHAAFFMQQSIECFIKGILIHSEVISSDKVKSISHKMEFAISEFYKKVGSEYSLNIIQNIQIELSKYENLSDRITKVIVPYVNNIIEQFENAKTDSTFGVITIQSYINNMLILLSLLLDHNTQQTTRYYDNNSYPCEKYTACSQLDKVIEYLDSINKWIKFLSNKII